MSKSGTAKSNYIRSTWAEVMKITSQNYKEEMDEHMLIGSGGTADA